MHRVFVPESSVNGNVIVIGGEQARHLSRSLRMKRGEKMTVVAGGKAFDCTLSDFSADTVTATIVRPTEKSNEPPSRITLCQAVTKTDSDSIVRRAVECGASEIVLFSSVNCVSRPGDGFASKLERLNRISREAAEQCGRDIIPPVSGPLSYEKALESSEGLVLFCYEGERALHISDAIAENRDRLDRISLFIGPEGGFTPEEVGQAARSGAVIVGLGPRILRAETASSFALAAVSCLTEK